MLNKFLKPQLDQLDNGKEIWFQQDGATAHTAGISISLLKQWFPSRLISRRGNVEWPARSPDLAPCDFFLWGYLKEKVYRHRPQSIQDLKKAISLEIRRIPKEITDQVMRSFRERLRQCADIGGCHLNDVIFKT